MAGEHGANWSKHNDQKHHHPSLQSHSQWKDSQAGRGSTALAPASLHSVLHYTGKTSQSRGKACSSETSANSNLVQSLFLGLHECCDHSLGVKATQITVGLSSTNKNDGLACDVGHGDRSTNLPRTSIFSQGQLRLDFQKRKEIKSTNSSCLYRACYCRELFLVHPTP